MAGQRKGQANSSCVNTMLYLHDKNIQLAPFLTFQFQQRKSQDIKQDQMLISQKRAYTMI